MITVIRTITAAAYAKEFLTYVPRMAILTTLKAANVLDRDKKVAAFLQSLYTCPYSERKDRNRRRVPGTCKWFTDHHIFRCWNNDDDPTILWVSADPGCGKSCLARYLVDDVLLTPGHSRTICYFFKDDYPDQRASTSALCALLRQVILDKPYLFNDEVAKKVDRDGDMLFRSFNDL